MIQVILHEANSFAISKGGYLLTISSEEENEFIKSAGVLHSWMGLVKSSVNLESGCSDELAENYNSDAVIDDSSCEYPDNGDYSLSFDGVDDYVEIGNSTDLNPSTALSVSLYFKTAEQGRVQYIFSNETSGSQGGFSIHLRERGAIWFQMVDTEQGNKYSESVEEYNDNQWHHLIATWSIEDGLGKVYVDGSEITYLDNNQFNINNYNPSSINFTVGTRMNSNDNEFNDK